MKSLRVVIMDDGINPDYLPADIPLESYTVQANHVVPTHAENTVTHGTLCSYIFDTQMRKEYGEKLPYALTSLKILDSFTGSGSLNALLSAFRWCAAQRHIDILLMSMGTAQYEDFAPIAREVRRLVNRNPDLVILSACNNKNTLTFPACLPEVIGVRHLRGSKYGDSLVYISEPYDCIEVLASVADLHLPHEDKVYTAANSFAVPVVAAHICGYLSQGYQGIKAVREKMNAEMDNPWHKSKLENGWFQAFYREMFEGNWEEIMVPLVLIPTHIPKASRVLKGLVSMFGREGYRAVGFTDSLETNANSLIFRLHWGQAITFSNLVAFYYNFTKPDIIFLHLCDIEKYVFTENIKPDIIIGDCNNISDSFYSDWNSACILYGDGDIEDLAVRIKNKLSG